MKNWLTLALLVTAAHSAGAANPAKWAESQTGAHALHGKQGQPLNNPTDLAPTTQIDIAVSLKLRNQGTLNELTAKIQAGKSNERLNGESIVSDFSPTADQVRQVTDYLAQAGFTKISVADNRLLVFATGNNSG
jgi:subtilase family serine protease